MNMLWKMVEPKYQANPILARSLNILFIFHADHEQNCSANVMRAVGSALADPFVSVAAAATLSGPLHGGINEEVLKMLDEIGSKDPCLEQLKAGHGRLMGFRHRVYKNYVRALVLSNGPPISMKRKMYPNVDFYSGTIYRRWAPSRNVCGAVCDSAQPSAGLRSGRRCSRIWSRRLPVPCRSISETRRESLCRLSVGDVACAGRLVNGRH